MSTDVKVTQLEIPAGLIDLGVGQPDPSLLPLELMRESVIHRVAQPDPLPWLAYGVEQGNGRFRVALADFLTRHYGLGVGPNELFVTNGSSQALAYICTLFTRPGDTVLVEEPSYFLALRIFADHGLEVVGVPMDEDGLIVEAVEQAAREHRARFLYTIPSFHNPSAVTLPEARRERLVELSRQHGFLIVADEVYHLLSYGEAPPAPLAAWIDAETVLSIGSFSKILAPGLRLGWIQAGATPIDRLLRHGVLDSGGGLNPFTSSMVHSALELGLQDQHLLRLRREYGHRAAVLGDALRRHLPGSVDFVPARGGFFVWLRLPAGIDAELLLSAARAHDVAFKPGHLFSSSGASRDRARVCFAYYDAEQLESGVRRLARALADR